MTIHNSRQGFTLLELLVVVLIIGILSAVALPQYQISVTKSRYANLKTLVDSIAQAQRIYFLENGEYTRDFEALTIEMPNYTSETKTSAGTYRYFSWGMCSLQTAQVECLDNKGKIRYNINLSTHRQQCVANTTDQNAPANKVCKMETGKTSPKEINSSSSYTAWNY